MTGLASALSNNIIIADGAGNRRINVIANGNIGINNISPTESLDVTGAVRFSGALMPNNTSGTAGQVLTSAGIGLAPTWTTPFTSTSGWTTSGNSGTNQTTSFIGTTDSVGIAFRTNNTIRLIIGATGNLGIGTNQISDTGFKLFVEKGIRTRKVKVDVLAWSDYVFDKDYKLASLTEVDQFIQKNSHLPGVISASDATQDGIDVAENQATLLKKIEELTLYLIEHDKRMTTLDKQVKKLSSENKFLKKKLTSLNK